MSLCFTKICHSIAAVQHVVLSQIRHNTRHIVSHQLPLLTPVGKPGGFDLGTVRSFFSFLAHRTALEIKSLRVVGRSRLLTPARIA